MTERSRAALAAEPAAFRVGPSEARWEDDGLTLDLDEVAVPWPRRIKGRVRFTARAITDRCFELDRSGRHRWWPIAPSARVSVELDQPALRWQGDGYLDSNEGSEPLERGFQRWNWSRAHLPGDSTALLYEPLRRDGTGDLLALEVDRTGAIQTFEAPPLVRLPGTLWRVGRETRADREQPARVEETLEDTPFYSRSRLSVSLGGRRVEAMHESLCLDRFDSRLVQMLLPFRMPRRRR